MWPFYTLIFDSFLSSGSSHFFIFPSRTGSEQLWVFTMFFSLCRPEWPGIRKDARTSASRVLTLKMCASALSFTSFLNSKLYCLFLHRNQSMSTAQGSFSHPAPHRAHWLSWHQAPPSPNTDNLIHRKAPGYVLKSFQVRFELLWKVL